jgi:hypothetical protein
MLNMHAVIAMRELFLGSARVRYECIETRHLFFVKDLAIIRVKQLDEKHRSRNYPTQASNNIYRQQGLPGLEDLPWLTVGLVPNQDWTNYAGIFMAHPRTPNANDWVLDLTTGSARNINEFEINFDDVLTEPTTRRFRPRRDGEAEESIGGAGA